MITWQNKNSDDKLNQQSIFRNASKEKYYDEFSFKQKFNHLKSCNLLLYVHVVYMFLPLQGEDQR